MVTITDEGLSYVQYEADGSAVNFSLTFPYLLEEHISVFKNGVLQTLTTDWSWLNASEIQMVVAPADGDLITIKRNTQNTERFVNFEDGGVLRETTLDLDSNQLFYLSQEAIDTTNFNLAINSTDSTIDAQNNKIINLANGTTSTDAVNKAQLDAVQAIADTADTNASTALSTANGLAASIATANANASAAIVTADTAQATADAAVVTADAAQSTADGLAASIATANANASAAVITADAAAAAVAAAQADATQALADAATAQGEIDAHEALTEAHGATGAVVGTTNTQTLTNKTLQGASIETPSRLDVKQDTRANLETYAAGASNGQLCFATDLKKMYQVVDGVLKDVGGAGGLNYIEGGDAEGGAIGASYQDSPDVVPEDGVGGSPTVTLTASSIDPLRGTKSFLFSKTGNRQGEGHGIDFTIDAADKASIQRISFDYSTTANYEDGDIRIYIFDVGNSRLIEVVDRDLYASEFGRYSGTFQTSPDSTSYRLIFHVADGGSASWDVKIDNIVVGPQVLIKGMMGTDTKSTTVSSLITGATTNPTFGTLGVNLFAYSRRGENLVFNGSLVQSTAGTIGSGTYFINLPDGLVVDSTKISSSNSGAMGVCGSCIFWDGTSYYTGSVTINYSGGSKLELWFGDETSAPTRWGSSNYPFSLTNLRFSFFGEVPILGWSSNMTLSEDAGNREIALLATDVAGTLSNTSFAYNDLNFTAIQKDTTGSYAVAGYTIPETGEYDITLGCAVTYGTTPTAGNDSSVGIKVNSSDYRVSFQKTTGVTSQYYPSGKWTVSLTKGDLVTPYFRKQGTETLTFLNATDDRFQYFTIAKRSSPQTIGAGDVVAARYTSTSGQSINATNTVMVMENRVVDTHNAYNTSNGAYTVPQSGFYDINFRFWTATFTPSNDTNALDIRIRLNGGTLANGLTRTGTITASTYAASVTALSVYLSKGAVIEAAASCSTTTTMNAAGTVNEFSIHKVNGVS